MTTKIVLATGNKGKVAELSQMLAPFNFQVVPQTELGVTDADEDGFVFPAGFFEGIWMPGEPIHGIIRMLEEVGGGFVAESIHGQPCLEKASKYLHSRMMSR